MVVYFEVFVSEPAAAIVRNNPTSSRTSRRHRHNFLSPFRRLDTKLMSVVPESAADAQGRRTSISWNSWSRGIRSAAISHTRTRYSTAKATRFFDFAAKTSTWRHIFIVAAMPVPGLLVSLVAPLIPLQPPSAGVLKNWGFPLHVFVTTTFTMTGAMFQTRSVTGISHSLYSNVDIACAAMIGSAHVAGFITLVGYWWRFPVPFSWIVCFAPWVIFLIWGNVLVLRSRLVQSSHLRSLLLFNIPSMVVQLCQILCYPAFSAAFEVSTATGQYVLIALFPIIKWLIKRTIYALSHHLTEFAKEISVSGVEICASIYQSTIMQNTPSASTTALVIGLDIFQGLFDLKLFLDHDSVVPNDEILSTAMEVLQSNRHTLGDSSLQPFATSVRVFSPNTKHIAAMIVPFPKPARRKAFSRVVSVVSSRLERETLVVTQALELLQAADTLLLVEYLEVAVPIVNAVYLCVASQLKSAIYNPKLDGFYFQPEALQAAVASVLLYASLQAVTLILMGLVVRVRYRLSPLTLLAFMLEDHAWSLQGKMFEWLPSMLAFSVLQYGVDFSFRFDYSVDPHA